MGMGSDRWDEPPLDIQIPDDARELDRDVLAYRRELRAARRRRRLKRIVGPLAGHGTIMPLLASILAVCLVAGAMLSVATFSPAPGVRSPRPTPTASSPRPAATHAGHSANQGAAKRASPSASPSHRASGSPGVSSSTTPR
jgi:hypothetical protein